MSIGKIRGSARESSESFRADLNRRNAASGILSDTDLFSESLQNELVTTLGGEYRPLSLEDLAAFRRRAGVVKARSTKNKIIGGITANQIIAFSRPSPNIIGQPQKRGFGDIDRANREITMAVLSMANKGKLRFITNASGSTPNVSRHHINISLQAYSQAKAMPKNPKDKIALGRWLANSPLKFECDCMRHTFWYRYIASIGGWCEGRIENGYPKVRNAKLIGVACKHTLRVMREMTTSINVHRQLGEMLLSESPVGVKQADANRMTKQQKRRPKVISQTAAKRAIQDLKNKVGKKAKDLTRERKKINGITAELNRQIAQLNKAYEMKVIDKRTRDEAIERIMKDAK